jgi:hypothetical protein
VRRRCIDGDATEIYLKLTGCEGVAWNHLAQDRNRWWAVVNAAMNIQVA